MRWSNKKPRAAGGICCNCLSLAPFFFRWLQAVPILVPFLHCKRRFFCFRLLVLCHRANTRKRKWSLKAPSQCPPPQVKGQSPHPLLHHPPLDTDPPSPIPSPQGNPRPPIPKSLEAPLGAYDIALATLQGAVMSTTAPPPSPPQPSKLVPKDKFPPKPTVRGPCSAKIAWSCRKLLMGNGYPNGRRPYKPCPPIHLGNVRQRMKHGAREYTTVLRVKFGCLTAHHKYLWFECRQKGCVGCPWINKHGFAHLFLHKGGRLHQVRGSHKFLGVSNLEDVCIIQPILHNTKGGAPRLLGVIGYTLLGQYKHELLLVIAHVANLTAESTFALYVAVPSWD